MKLIKELLAEALKFRLHDIIKTPKGSGKVVRVFRNKIQVTFDKGPDAVFDLADLKPLNEAVSPLKKMAKALKFPAGTSYHEGSQNWPDSAEWRKRGGYAGQKSQAKTMDAMKGLGFVKANANSSHNGDGSHFHDDWTYETDEWTLTFHEHTGSVKSENSYSMKLTKKKPVTESSDMIEGAPLDVLVEYMKKNGFKSVTLNGGSYGYTTTLEQLSKPRISWTATDGSRVSVKSIKDMSKYLDSKTEWIDFCDQKKTVELEIESLDWLLKFNKGKTPKYDDQESWEEAGMKGDLG